MLEILQYATSGFWTFVGCFLLLGLMVRGAAILAALMLAALFGKKESTT